MTIKEAQWDKFTANLYDYILTGRSHFIKHDYEVRLNMSDAEVLRELGECSSVEQFSPELKRVAEEYLARENRQKRP